MKESFLIALRIYKYLFIFFLVIFWAATIVLLSYEIMRNFGDYMKLIAESGMEFLLVYEAWHFGLSAWFIAITAVLSGYYWAFASVVILLLHFIVYPLLGQTHQN